MLHKLSLDASSMAIFCLQVGIQCVQVDFHLVSKYSQTIAPVA